MAGAYISFKHSFYLYAYHNDRATQRPNNFPAKKKNVKINTLFWLFFCCCCTIDFMVRVFVAAVGIICMKKHAYKYVYIAANIRFFFLHICGVCWLAGIYVPTTLHPHIATTILHTYCFVDHGNMIYNRRKIPWREITIT